MRITEYSWMDTEELLLFIINKDTANPMEHELAHRLMVALDKIKELEHGHDAGRPSEERRQEAFDS